MNGKTLPHSLKQTLKATHRCIYICLALVLLLSLVAGMALWQYDDVVEEGAYNCWTHDYISAFTDVPVREEPIIQKFTACEKRLKEFILLLENYDAADTATVCVTLEDKGGNVYYQWAAPVSVLGGDMFCLNAKVDEPLRKGRDYFIRIALQDGESTITTRCLLKTDYKEAELHPSVKELTIAGEKQDALLYFGQKYETALFYGKIWFTALAVTALLLLALAFCKGPAWKVVWEVALATALPAVSYYATELLGGNISTVKAEYAVINCLIVLAGHLILKAVVGKAAFYITVVLTLLAGATNFYVLQFKGVAFLLTDISAFSTAMSVADNYVFTFPPVLFTVLMLYACLILVQVAADRNFAQNYKRPGVWKRTACLAGAAAAILLTGLHIQTVTFDYFEVNGNFSKYGWWYSNVCVLKNSSMKKPANYSEKTVKKILADVEEPEGQAVVPQNLIVIMNEAWSDLSVIGQMETEEDCMPFIRSLKENTVKGNLHVPTFGGGTCYTEYEFLTGNALRFMPAGSIPYAKSKGLPEEPAVASILKAQGYRTVAMHPYGPKNWNRDQVYPAMGFDEFLSIDDYEGGEYIRNYISDKSDYDKIIEYYEQHKGENLFVFNVTMQNHGGYDINNGTVDAGVTLSNIQSDEANTYLSLIRETDKAFRYLLSYFTEVEEPTMIVMFGDHLPALPESFYTALYGKEESQRTEEEINARFMTPYVIWTNYPSDFAQVPDVSVNYLGSLVLQYAGMEMPRYNQFLLKQMAEIPVLGLKGIYDSSGQFTAYDSISDELLREYKTLQYLRVEDRSSELYDIFRIKK